ncbi:MAG: hypothetical protein AAF721_21450 [Myxococcota bacterium]
MSNRAIISCASAALLSGCLYDGTATRGLPCNIDADCDELACVQSVCGGPSADVAGSDESGDGSSGDEGEMPTEQEFEDPCSPSDDQECVDGNALRWCTDDRKLVTFHCQAICGPDDPVGDGCQTDPRDGIDYCWCESHGGVPSGTCTEGCSFNSDCSAGERCFSTTQGNLCGPSQCEGCFANEQTCNFTPGSCQYTGCE